MNDEGKSMHITITGTTFVNAIVILLLFYALFLLRSVVVILLTAVVIASAIEPMTRALKRYRIGRLPAVIMIYAAVAILIFGVFYLLVPPLLSETAGFLTTIPQYVGSFDLAKYVADLEFVGSTDAIQHIGGGISVPEIVSNLSKYLTYIPGGAFNTVSAVFGGVFSLTLIVIFSFYLAVQENGIENFLKIVIPFKHQRYAIDLWQRSQQKIGLWMQGQLLLILIIAVLVYLGLTILGVEHALLFALLAGLFELIPLFGPILASIPAIVVGFIDGGLTLALIVAGLYVIIQQFENHLIYPLVVNKVVGVPSLLVILALIVGAELAGFLGIILSVPIAATLMEFTNDIQKRNRALEERHKTAPP